MGGHCAKTEGLKGVVDGQIDITEGWKDIAETSSNPSQGQSIASSADSRPHRIGVRVPPTSIPGFPALRCVLRAGPCVSCKPASFQPQTRGCFGP